MFTVTIKLSHNAGLTHTFSWLDSDRQPISLAGATLKAWIKRNINDATPALELSTANGKIVIDPDNPHRFSIKIPANVLIPTIRTEKGVQIDTPYVFDLLRVITADERPLIMKGTISVFKGVTE